MTTHGMISNPDGFLVPVTDVTPPQRVRADLTYDNRNAPEIGLGPATKFNELVRKITAAAQMNSESLARIRAAIASISEALPDNDAKAQR